METFEVLKSIKAMKDLTQQPSYVVKNFDIDTGAFDVYYNDGALKNDDWYGPINMDLDMMRPEDEEPIRMQIARRVLSYVQTQQLVECPMEASKLALSQMLGVEQQFSAMDVVKHEEAMRRKDTASVDPIYTSTQIMNIYSEDDFDEQFEALSAELAED